MADENELPVTVSAEERGMFQELLARGGAPAFMVRATRAQEALEVVLQQCRRQREEWLGMARLRLGTLLALAGDWPALRPLLADDDALAALRALHDSLQPQLRVVPAVTDSSRVLRRAARELADSVEFFNQRWRRHLGKIDLTAVNRLRDKHNAYYLLEKECVVRSPVLARREYRPLPALTPGDLLELLPPLPAVRLAV